MYTRIRNCHLWRQQALICRCLSTAEVSTALRPFYFFVHPDLFGKYPEQRKVNENSLKHLSALLEAQRDSRQRDSSLQIPSLTFYLRNEKLQNGNFKQVQIRLSGNNVRATVVKILSACEISTAYVDKIPKTTASERGRSRKKTMNEYREMDETFSDLGGMEQKIKEARGAQNVIQWIKENSKSARDKYESTQATRDQVDAMLLQLNKSFGIKEVKWDNSWNISHIRGAVQSFLNLALQRPLDMKNLKGRTVAFGQFTGVSLDGDVFLSIVEVRNTWSDFIKNLKQHDSALLLIPAYEKTLSRVLRDIHIKRRKFMPKVSGSQYCGHLRYLTTSIGDFYGTGWNFPKSVPPSLSQYEIVIEPEAGPLMLSPTGQFITPSTCPAAELINFISEHLDEAVVLLTEYSINKHVEKALYKEVKERFGLLALHKDDSVTPSLMILCCQRLLTRIDSLHQTLNGNILFITHYYSVLSDGVLCIPWDFK